ncbi:Gfo/Idh/MocA family oxidoreductase [Sphingobacterium sp. lm-10]|uniref:Gfo/Idh/MocA family oxidoreductase n=1 Tax=Sphingobacterium sp. lm-10 TaxID=2944904 RepID=UPI002020B907|nr:Gfo/Idh/MocA family oxidoreductase [Sphingobacterium sp. lm-10]MCL7986390.1 Gfo/Idh/MocA family oxidoreductase [Sphingobacterium sp. lm-10]
MNKQGKIITGLLAYGMSGKVFHAPFLYGNDLFDLRAVVERTKKNAHVDYPGIISYDSVDDFLLDPQIELVIVNTPNDTHFEFAKRAIEYGKHVLIEKPFAPTLEEANELFALGEKYRKQVFAYHNRRFDSDFLSLKYVLDKKFVGQPIELHLRFDRYKTVIGPKVFKETKRPGAGVIYDLGSHLLDQALSLFGKPKSMTKIAGAYREASEVDDYGTIILSYVDGLNVFITTSLLAADPQAAFVLHGTQGSFIKQRADVQEAQLLAGVMPNDPIYGLEAPDVDGLLTVNLGDGELEKIVVPSERGQYSEVFRQVYESIRHAAPYYVTADQIRWQLEILSPAKRK